MTNKLDKQDHEEMKSIVHSVLSKEIDEQDYPIDILRGILVEASEIYSNMINPEDEPFLTDYEYDEITKIVKKYIPDYKEQIGSEVRGGKIKLPFILGSLDRAFNNETLEWINKNNLQEEYFIISDKQDGTSGASIHNENGLVISYSRGDGYEGADITRHIRKITNYPNTKSEFKVRYEVITPYELFYARKVFIESSGKKFYKNPRNYTAGKMNSEVADDDFFSMVKVIATSMIDSDLDKDEQFKLLQTYGFETTPYIKVKGKELNEQFLINYLEKRKQESKTELDGIVIDINSSKIRNSLDWTSENPPYAKKFKVNREEDMVTSTITNVLYEPSKDGYMKPRIEVVPVDINGVTVTYCNGQNCGYIRDNLINIGATVLISRRGDVIPYCEAVLIKSDNALLPTVEEYGEMYWTDTGVDLVLVDKKSNKQVIINEILHASTTLNLPALKEGSIKKLVDNGYKSFTEICFAQKEELQEVIGNSAGKLVYEGIVDKFKSVRVETLADASQTLGRGIGERTCKKIFETIGYFNFIDKKFTKEDLIKCEDVGEKTADLILRNIDNFIDFMNNITGICNIELPKEGELTGLSFIFTGIRDNLLKESIENKGGEFISTISKKKDMYLICKNINEKSSKLDKAREILPADRILDINEARKRWL